jgi:hypothetical protein
MEIDDDNDSGGVVVYDFRDLDVEEPMDVDNEPDELEPTLLQDNTVKQQLFSNQ